MWRDNYGNEYETEEEGIDNLVENYIDDQSMLYELDYYFTSEQLLNWIYNTPIAWNLFKADYEDEIEEAKIAYAKGELDYEDEEEDW